MVPRELGGRRPVDEGESERLGIDACKDAVPDCQHLAVNLLRPTVTGQHIATKLLQPTTTVHSLKIIRTVLCCIVYGSCAQS